jgi:gluconate 2-dehydrogenase gamma chain
MVRKGPSRRDMLKGVGLAAAPLAVPVQAVPAPHAEPPRETLETLTAAEAACLTAITGRLIPTDANGPGAIEAKASRYIDRALAGPLSGSREAYRAGLSAIDALARETRGQPFAALQPAEQDALLTLVERNQAPGFANSAAFFTLVRGHTLQGTFSDPYYGGNAGFVGWDLIGYPGVRMGVGPELQKMGERPAGNHVSAYDLSSMFHKAGEDDGAGADKAHAH